MYNYFAQWLRWMAQHSSWTTLVEPTTLCTTRKVLDKSCTQMYQYGLHLFEKLRRVFCEAMSCWLTKLRIWIAHNSLLCLLTWSIAGLFRTMYILGYIPKDNRLYLSDKDMNVVGYSLLLSVLEYQTAVMRQDFETAKQVQCTCTMYFMYVFLILHWCLCTMYMYA